MVAVYQSFAHRSGGLGADPVVPKPAGTVDGDLLIAVGICTNAQTITPPAGWTTHPSSLGNTSPLFYKIASSEPASYQFAVSSTANSQIVIVRVSGHNPATPIDVAAGVAAVSGNHILPSVTPTGPDRLLLQINVKMQNTTFTGPASATERWDATSADQNAVSAGGDEVVGAAATGTRTWVPASSNGVGAGYAVAITPASVPAQGSASGSWNYAGSATGDAPDVPPAQGSASGGWNYAGSATGDAPGTIPAQGSASGTWDYTGSAQGLAPGGGGDATIPPYSAGARRRRVRRNR